VDALWGVERAESAREPLGAWGSVAAREALRCRVCACTVPRSSRCTRRRAVAARRPRDPPRCLSFVSPTPLKQFEHSRGSEIPPARADTPGCGASRERARVARCVGKRGAWCARCRSSPFTGRTAWVRLSLHRRLWFGRRFGRRTATRRSPLLLVGLSVGESLLPNPLTGRLRVHLRRRLGTDLDGSRDRHARRTSNQSLVRRGAARTVAGPTRRKQFAVC